MLKVASSCTDAMLAAHSRYRHDTLKSKLFNAESESDICQALFSLYDLDLVGNLEKYRVDYTHPEIWLEVKFKINVKDRADKAKVISQMLHYLHYAPTKRGEVLLPNTFGISDNSYITLYDTEAFGNYIINPGYFKDIKSPSAAHPELERALFADPLLKGLQLHVISDYEEVWSEFNKRGAYELSGS